MSIYDKASLVLIPSGTKTSKVYSQKPVSGDGDFTFSRSTAATRVNADGNIEKETQNLLLQSNSFDTSWTKNNVTTTSGQSGYDGSNDAWLLSKGAAAFTNLIQSVTTSGVNTFSVYAKSGTLTQLTLRDSATNIYARFNLSDGSLITTSGSPIATSIEDVGSGWYRCSITMSMSSASLQIYPDWNQTTAGNIYIQDAQLEQGLVARDYIETTTAAVEGGITDNVPRLDYTDSSCPALLLEPQRTNLITHSEYIGGYTNYASTDTHNDLESPEGVENAVLFAGDGSQSQVFLSTPDITLSSAGSYTISVFAKKGTNDYMQISLDGFVGAGNGSAYFDLENGTTPTSGASVEDYGNGWYRCIVVVTIAAGDLVGKIALRVSSSTSSFFFSSASEANGKSIYIYGVQFEQGSYATSYIPTYGTSVTRNADAALKTGVADLINDGEGSLYMEVTPTNFEGDQRFGISDNIGANRIVLRLFNPSNLQLSCVIGSSVQVSISNNGYSAGNTYKIAGAWKDNDAVIYINGVQVATDTNCNITPSNPLTRISFDNGVGSAKWENPVSQTMYFPTRLSNEELAELTTI